MMTNMKYRMVTEALKMKSLFKQRLRFTTATYLYELVYSRRSWNKKRRKLTSGENVSILVMCLLDKQLIGKMKHFVPGKYVFLSGKLRTWYLENVKANQVAI